MNYIIYLISIILLAFASCSSDGNSELNDDSSIYIVATTGMIADAVSHVGGDLINVEGLMGPGVDPHLYKATQGDLKKLNRADIIFYNGLHLEGKMGEVFEKLASKKPIVALADGIPESRLISVPELNNSHDPHIWFDVSLWQLAVEEVLGGLIERYPEHSDVFEANANAYLDSLEALHIWVGEQISQIPQESRVMITAHDAFSYFGAAYDIEVRGLQGISTVSEFGLKDVTELTNFIISRNIKAVFVESSVSERSINAVVEGCQEKGHDIHIGATLFSDAMGAAGTPEGTYLGMVRYNVNAIVTSLK